MPSLLPALVNKARKPKFELHLTIYDLNNVPLVSGTSHIQWKLEHGMHGDHRGRTNKCPIDSINHRVTYNYSKVIPLRITIDRNNNLTECPIHFEVAQEFPGPPGTRDEKIILGTVKLNLSEYVEESENFPRRSLGASLDQAREKMADKKRRSSNSSKSGNDAPSSPTASSSAGASDHQATDEDAVDEGIVRRYLMQDSKINSTLKVGILMVQVDGDRNYVAPALKTAPMFGGIAGIMASGESVKPPDDSSLGPGPLPNTASTSKSRETSEMQDMYRRALAASWSCQPGELPADECIEDIFAGGDGWKTPNAFSSSSSSHRGRHLLDDASSSRSSGSEDVAANTLRPSDAHRIRQHLHVRHHSGSSGKSGKSGLSTVVGSPSRDPSFEGMGLHYSTSNNSNRSQKGRSASRQRQRPNEYQHQHKRQHSRDSLASGFEHFSTGSSHHGRSNARRGSVASVAPTMNSLNSDRENLDLDRGREGFRRPREVDEFDVRDDLVSWALPGTAVV